MRLGEAYALTVGQFQPLARTLTIDRSATGPTKTGETRTIPLPSVVADMLVDHIARFGSWERDDALVFPSDGGRMVDPNNWRRRVWAPALAAAGIAGLRVADLRHTAVAFAVAAGADIYSVQRMVGHAKPSITLDVYGHLWDGSGERLAERLDAAIRETWADVATVAKVVGGATATTVWLHAPR